MAFTSNDSGAHLEVKLEHAPHKTWYCPGETIIGRVHRRTPGAIPGVKVTVALSGISESKITIQVRDSRRKAYRGFFGCIPAATTLQILEANKPLHIPQDSNGVSWPFALTIPSSVGDVRSVHQRGYAAPGPRDGTGYTPLGTYGYSGGSWFEGTEYECSIRYSVDARIELYHQRDGQTTTTTRRASASIFVKNVTPGPPLTDFSTWVGRWQRSVSTYQLVPGTEGLNLGQRARKLFQSTKVPTLGLAFEAHVPDTLQTENTAPIPFILRIRAVPEQTSENVRGLDVPQRIIISGFGLRIKATTRVKAEKENISKTSDYVDLVSPIAMNKVRAAVFMVATGGSAEPTTLNLGEMLNLRLKRSLTPSFSTYNISVRHDLMSELRGSVAGEKFEVAWSHQIKILPQPSDVVGGGGGGGGISQDPSRGVEEEEEQLPAYLPPYEP